jgi:hypothetical protein
VREEREAAKAKRMTTEMLIPPTAPAVKNSSTKKMRKAKTGKDKDVQSDGDKPAAPKRFLYMVRLPRPEPNAMADSETVGLEASAQLKLERLEYLNAALRVKQVRPWPTRSSGQIPRACWVSTAGRRRRISSQIEGRWERADAGHASVGGHGLRTPTAPDPWAPVGSNPPLLATVRGVPTAPLCRVGAVVHHMRLLGGPGVRHWLSRARVLSGGYTRGGRHRDDVASAGVGCRTRVARVGRGGWSPRAGTARFAWLRG